jgi:hypothetical protein
LGRSIPTSAPLGPSSLPRRPRAKALRSPPVAPIRALPLRLRSQEGATYSRLPTPFGSTRIRPGALRATRCRCAPPRPPTRPPPSRTSAPPPLRPWWRRANPLLFPRWPGQRRRARPFRTANLERRAAARRRAVGRGSQPRQSVSWRPWRSTPAVRRRRQARMRPSPAAATCTAYRRFLRLGACGSTRPAPRRASSATPGRFAASEVRAVRPRTNEPRSELLRRSRLVWARRTLRSHHL